MPRLRESAPGPPDFRPGPDPSAPGPTYFRPGPTPSAPGPTDFRPGPAPPAPGPREFAPAPLEERFTRIQVAPTSTDDLSLAPISTWLADEATFFTKLKAAYANDPNFQVPLRPQLYTEDRGIWYVPAYFGPHGATPITAHDTKRLRHVPRTNGKPDWNGRLIVVPRQQQLLWQLCKEAHDSPTAGHQGVTRTTKCIQMNFWTPNLEKCVKEYVSSCDACSVSKPDNRQPAGLLQPLPIPSQPWEIVSMDFIVKLPTTPRGHDTVFTVVDMLTKQVHFIPTREAISAQVAAGLYFDNIVRHHGLPKAMVSDCDQKFLSHFWKNLFQACGTCEDSMRNGTVKICATKKMPNGVSHYKATRWRTTREKEQGERERELVKGSGLDRKLEESTPYFILLRGF